MKNHFFKKALSVLVAVLLVMSILPMTAFAEPEDAVAYPEGAVAYVTDADGAVVAEIEGNLGDGYYKTLAAAIAACPTDGTEATITMLNDEPVTSTLQVTNQKHITIDLNGNEVFGWFNTLGTSALINNKGYLTLKDSSDTNCNGSGNGKLTSKATKPDLKDIPGYASNVINNEGGHLTIESGYYESLTDTGYASYVVDNNANSCSSYLTVNGGKLYSTNTDVIRLCCNAGAACENIVTINGGIIAKDNTGDRAIWMQYMSGAVKNKAIVNMNGGRIIGGIATYSFTDLNGDGDADGYFSEDQEKNVEFNIHGGSMDFLKVYTNTGTTCKIDISEKDGINSVPKIGNVNLYKYFGSAEMRCISAGYFNADVSNYVVEGKYCIPNKDKTDAYGVDVSGYKYKIGTEQGSEEDYVAKVIHSDETVTYYYEFSGAVKAATNGETVVLLKNAQELPNTTNFFINSITVDLGGYTVLNKNSYGFILDNGITATFKNGTITGSSRAFHCQKVGNSLTLENVTLTSNEDSSINVGSGSTKVTFEGKNNISSLNSDCIASYGTVTIDAKEGSETTITANASGCDGIFSYGGIAVDGTGKLDVNGVNAGVHVYQYYSCANNYGLEITNPNATFTCSKNAVEVSHYYDEGYYGDNTSVHITGGTYNGPVSIESIWKTNAENLITGGTFNDDVKITSYYVNTTITGGTYKEDVSIYNKDEYDATISGGTFSGSVYVENKYANANVTISDGTFNDMVEIYELSGYYDLTNAKGDNVSVTGGKFAVDLSANYYDSGYKSAKVISGGIFANGDTLLYGGTEYYTSWPYCIDPAYAKAANDDDNTKVQYPFTVKPLEIKVNPETIENATKKDIEGNDLPEAAEEKVEEALENTLNNSAVGLFVETGIDDATKTKTVTSDNFNISMVLDAVKEAAKDASKNLASDTAVDENAKASGNGQITIKDEDITDMMIDKKVNVDLEASKIEVTMDTQNPEQVSMTTVNGATFDVKPTATVTITDGTGEVISKVTAVIPNKAITKPITFRLPVDPQIGANLKIASVWHSDDKDNFKKDYLGIFPIQCENGEYFIELSAKEFSYYTYENMMNIKETSVAVIRANGNYTGFDTLKDAIAAFNAGTDEDDKTVDNAVAIILLDDIAAGQKGEGTSFNFDNKVVELDLNGYLFTADPAEGTGVTNATGVTVINSDDDMAKKRLAATGIYANDVSEFIVDGYDVKTTTVENDTVFNNTDAETFNIEVIASTETDHDSSNNDATLHEENRVDVYADEYVGVKVVVNGARFTAADVTLTWDTSLFEDDTAVWDLPNGWNEITDNNGNIIGWRFTSPKDSDSYYPAGTILGEFSFKALYINESKINGTDNLCTFTVKNDKEYSHDAKVIGSWGITLADDSTDPVPAENLYDDSALIMLMNSMTGAVEGKTNLIYKGSDINQKLLNDKYNGDKGWSAKVGGQEYGNATIEYAVLTPDNAKLIGENKPDSEEKYTLDDFLTYSDDLPTGKDAGEYTVYYRIMADGYQTVENSVKVTIAKQKVNLEWIAPVDFTGSGSIFTGEYNATGFNAPTAKFSNLDGGDTVLDPSEILWTSGPNDDKTLKDVGEYTFTAQDQKNYEFNNPTATVKVTGKAITGWALEATGNGTIYQADGETVDKSQGVIWRDGTAYAIGELKIADNASVKYTAGEYKDADNNVLQNVKLVYEYSEDNGHTWLSVLENDPSKLTYDELGTRKLRLTVTADNYEKLVLDATFTIKNPIFKVENLEYVAGYSIVLVYTNEDAVSFKYDNQMLYDVSIFGYKYNNNNYYNGTEQHAHVFGYVIKGAADISKIYASNDDALQLNLPENYNSSTESFVNDVNNKTTASVDLDDITAVQSIYVANAENIADIQLALRSDVNRDKRVDVNGDVSQVSAYYLAS